MTLVYIVSLFFYWTVNMGIIYCAGTPDVIHWCYFIDLCYKAEESLHLKCNLYI